MNKARGRTGILTVLGLWLALGGMAAAATRNWKNTGTDWGTAANWVENAVPVGTDTVVIPSVPTNQPTIADARSISNLTINGNNPTPLWNIGGAGTLTIDGGTVTFQTGGQALMSCNLALNGNTSFIVGPYSQPPTLWLLGTLTGTGPLNQTLLSGWNNFWVYLAYSNNTPPTFTGGTFANYCGVPCWYLTGNAGTYTYGLDAAGLNPGTITINGGGFGFVASTTPGPVQPLTLNNPIAVTAAGGCLFGVQLVTNVQAAFSGNLALGGPLAFGDQMGGNNPRAASAASSPTVSFGGPIALQRHARAVCQQYGFGRSVSIAGNIVDQFPAAPTPLLLSAAHGGGAILSIANPASTGNTYAAGTVIDYCANMGGGQGVYNSRLEAAASTRLGTGGLTILPGGRMRLNAAQNVASGATVNVTGSPLAAGVLGVAFNGVPANLTNSASNAVLAIDTATPFTAISDQSTVGSGTMFLGTTLGAATLAPTGGTLLPGQGNTYRLGSGGATPASIWANPGTLTVNATLNDIGGNTALLVGQTAMHGQGIVSLSTNINTFMGPIDIWCPTLWYQNSTYLGQSQPAYSWLYGTAQQSPRAGSPFGYTNGTVNLHGAGIQITQAGSGTGSTLVVKGHLTFEGSSIAAVSAANRLTPFALGIDASSRTNGGFVGLRAINGLYQGNERILVAGGGNPPGYANGIAAPYVLAGTGDFAAYDTALSNGYVRGFAPYASYVTLPAGGGNGTEVVSQGALALTTNYNVYALKTTGALTSDGAANRTIAIGSGGLILGGNIGASGSGYQVNLNFGSSEGLIVPAAVNPYIYGRISGSGGLSVNTFLSNQGQFYLMNTNNNFTGTITLNPPGTAAVFDSPSGVGSLGPASNGIFFNGGMLVQNGGSLLAATRTLTLGPLGGRLNGTCAVVGRISGPGDLTVNNGTVTLRNDTSLGQGANDYAGGTRVLYSGALVVSNSVSLGSGDLVLESGGVATLWGNGNLGASARADVPYGATVNFTAPAPAFGNITGGGVLVLGNGTTPKNDTTLTLGGDNSSSAFYGLISQVSATAGQGRGSLTKTGAGTFTLSGTHTFTGPTTVNNGTLRLIGALAGNLIVAPGATLSGYGAVGGSLTNGGTLRIDLASAGAYDSFSVTGNVDIAGATLVLGGDYRPPAGTSVTIVQAASVSGTFASVPAGYVVKTGGGAVTVSRAAGSVVLFR